MVLMVSADLKVWRLNVKTLELEAVCDLADLLKTSLGLNKVRKQDLIITFASFNSQAGLLSLNLLGFGVQLFKIQAGQASHFWSLPKPLAKRAVGLSLSVCPQLEKLVVAYDSNHIQVFDLLNKCLHPWSRTNGDRFPNNFLTRFNRLLGVTTLSETRFLFYSNYTYTILDLAQDLPADTASSSVEIIQDHPGKPLDHSSSWFECLKKSQTKYLLEGQVAVPEKRSAESNTKNLTISNSIKGILSMSYDQKDKQLRVVENQWRKAVERFPGAMVLPKYGK